MLLTVRVIQKNTNTVKRKKAKISLALNPIHVAYREI